MFKVLVSALSKKAFSFHILSFIFNRKKLPVSCFNFRRVQKNTDKKAENPIKLRCNISNNKKLLFNKYSCEVWQHKYKEDSIKMIGITLGKKINLGLKS